MHELHEAIVTAGKGGSVAISALRPEGELQTVQMFESHHGGVVKCARWCNRATFASCGNDR